jgi:hypothetical protein
VFVVVTGVRRVPVTVVEVVDVIVMQDGAVTAAVPVNVIVFAGLVVSVVGGVCHACAGSHRGRML